MIELEMRGEDSSRLLHDSNRTVDQNPDRVIVLGEQVYAPHRNSSSTDPNPNPPLEPLDIQPPPPAPPLQQVIRYGECLKNHAASMGGQVTDGCGEFMPSGEAGLKCAACHCHRSFHRREVEGETPSGSTSYYPHRYSTIRRTTTGRLDQPPLPAQHMYSRAPVPTVMMAFGGGAAAESSSEDLNTINVNPVTGQATAAASRKRFRTKFKQDQKEKMQEFAERLGWKIQKQNEDEVHRFCAEIGLSRQVFKVWMHNAKQALKKKNRSE